MSNTYHDAADALERERNRYESLANAALVMREAGNLVQAMDEARAKKEQFERQGVQAEHDLQEALARIDTANMAADATVRKAKADGEEMIRAVTAKAEALEKANRERIEHNSADAQRRAERQQQAADQALQAARAEEASLKEHAAALEDMIAKKAAELSAVEGKLRSAKEAVAAMLA